MKLRPPFKIHGGKRYLADWIISHFPNNYTALTYLEPFCGAANVLLRKNPSHEIINDIDSGIYFILQAVRDTPYELQGRLESVPYCEDVFEKAKEKATNVLHEDKINILSNPIDFAINEFILRRMSRGGLKQAFAWSDRQRGGQPGDVNAWKTIIAQLPLISERLQEVVFFNCDALNFIKKFDDKNTIAYCDPPYVQQTRQSHNIYDHEMTNEGHERLADMLNSCKGKVIVSGYPSSLYDRLFSDWKQVDRQIPNHSSQQKIKQYKPECRWMNDDK
jgi:DNA adenine methylase